MEYRNLIIDGSFFIHLYTLTLSPLYNSELQDISITYYFLNRIYNIIETYKPLERVFIVLDIGRDLKKKMKYELYKANRIYAKKSKFTSNTLEEEQYNRLSFNRKLIYEILKTTPIDIFAIPYVEGDTILAFIKKYLDKETSSNNLEVGVKNSLIITADKDFVQIVDENTDLLLMNTINKNILYTYENDLLRLWILVFFSKTDLQNIDFFERLINTFKDEIQDKRLIISLRNLPFYRSFLGDSSDNITGIKGFGQGLVSSMVIFHQFKHIKNIVNKKGDYSLYEFKSVEDFLNFWRENISEFDNFVKNILKRKRISTNRLRQFLSNDKEIELWKTFFELMDFDYAIENLPIVAIHELNETLSINNNEQNTEFYKQREFLNYIYEFELNSELDYLKWNIINKVLELNKKSLLKYKRLTRETTQWNNYLSLLSSNKTLNTLKEIQNKIYSMISKTRLKELFL